MPQLRVDAVRMVGGVIDLVVYDMSKNPEPHPALFQSSFHPTLGSCKDGNVPC